MNHMRHQVLLASLVALVLFGSGCALVLHELGHWHLSATQVRLAHERGLLDGQFQRSVTRAIGETATFILFGDEHFRTEAHQALDDARISIDKIRRIEMRDRALPIIGNQWHEAFLPVPGKPQPSGILARQESLLELVDKAIRSAEARKAAGNGSPAELVKAVYINEEIADQLWIDATAVHQRARDESEQTADQHHRLVIVLVLASLAIIALLVAALLVFLGRGVVRPLIELAEGADKVARGDLEPHIEVRYSNEIGQLQARFNDMVGHLKRQRAEIERLVDSMTRARDAAEMASHAKSDFLAKMSHEIRTPMHGIFLTFDLLHNLLKEPSQRELTEVGRKSARTLVALIDDTLDFTRIESGNLKLEFAVFDLHEMLNSITNLEGRRAEAKGLQWEVRFGDDVPPRIWGDQLRMHQILRNLLDNAIRFTNEGRIGVEIEALPSPPVDADEKNVPVQLRFTVSDSGIGIDPAMAESIFQPFQQADESTTRRYGGSGLGLAIVRQIAELMGGTISVESTPGVGSRFSFCASFLPDARKRVREIPAPPARQPLPPGKHVLLVEDNAGNRLVMERLLRLSGLEVSTAEDGRKAIEAATDELFDLILMDCCMPGTDGFEATREIRALPGRRGRVPIIALTAYSLDEGMLRSRNSGMDGFLSKPYTEEQLLDMLQHWLGSGATPVQNAEPPHLVRAAG